MLGPLTFSQHLGAAKDLRRHCRMGIHRAGVAALGTCYSSCSFWQVVAEATCSVLGLLVATCCCFSEAVVAASC